MEFKIQYGLLKRENMRVGFRKPVSQRNWETDSAETMNNESVWETEEVKNRRP